MKKKKTKSKKTTPRAKPEAAKMKVVKPTPDSKAGRPEKLHFKIEMDGETSKISALGDMEKISRNLAGLVVRYPKLMILLEDAICLVRHQNFIEKEHLRTEKKQNNETTK